MIMHLHFSEFNGNAETLSYVMVDNGAKCYNKTEANFKSHYIVKIFDQHVDVLICFDKPKRAFSLVENCRVASWPCP